MRKLNSNGGILAFFLILIWLIIVFAGVLGGLLYKNGYLRIEYGEPPQEEEKIVYDENTLLQFEQKEKALKKYEAKLQARKDLLDKREEQIALAKGSLEEINSNIKSHENKIKDMFNRFSDEEEEDLKKLAQLYENMKAVKVTNIFDKLDKNTVAELLRRMKKRASAKILAEMGQRNAVRAAEISNIMQGKNKSDAFEEARKQ